MHYLCLVTLLSSSACAFFASISFPYIQAALPHPLPRLVPSSVSRSPAFIPSLLAIPSLPPSHHPHRHPRLKRRLLVGEGATWAEHLHNRAELSGEGASSAPTYRSKLDEFEDFIGRSALFPSLDLSMYPLASFICFAVLF